MVTLAIEVGILILLIAGIALCITAIVVLWRIAPPLLRCTRNLERVTSDATAVSSDIASNLAHAAEKTAVAADNIAVASESMVDATGDIATGARTVAALGQMNVPQIIGQVASGQINNLRQLAGYISTFFDRS